MNAPYTTLRYKIDRKSCLSPQLHQVGWAIFSQPVHDAENLPAHTHSKAYEICYIAHGGVDWWVEEELFEVKAGDVFMTSPGEKHGGLHDVMNPCELYWAQVEFPQNKVMPGFSRAETASLASELSMIEHRIFPGLADVPVFFKRIVDEHRSPCGHSRIIVRAALIELLVSVIRSYNEYRERATADAGYSKAVRMAVKLIDANMDNAVKMDDIAREVGLSTTAFYRQFSEQMHLTPGEYLTQQRIHKAKALLRRRDMSVTMIAHSLGYSSSQYFATIFKRMTGASPQAFRKQE